jgi:branched-chain amino acid transport system substrate-binding protein
VAVAAAACSSDGSTSPETTVASTTSTIAPPDETDGRLTIGLLLPASNPVLGQGLIDAAREAVARINDAGGVLGQSVRVIEQDEGLGDGTAAASIAALLEPEARVDAIVGPSSSLIALSNLDTIVEAGVVACSPTATALALDDYPDQRLFFRTIPSDSLQAVAISDLAERTGVQDVAIVYVDDAYGRPFASAVEEAIGERARAGSSPASYGFVRSDGDLATIARRIADSGADVVIVLANADDGTAFLEALDDTDFGSFTDVFVNDAFRAPEITQRIEALDPAFRELIRGVAPQAQSNDVDRPFDPPGLFAAQVFDCVNLIALAVEAAETDDPARFASQIPALTITGRACNAYDTCAALLEDGLNINYNGPDGLTEMLVVGDPARARFDVFSFDETGRSVFEESIEAG